MRILLRQSFVAGLLILTVVVSVGAKESLHGHSTDYSGQQDRQIKSLSAEDIAELQSGSGWGLAKAAELNGVPGPKHLLELKAAISLSQAQVEAIEQIFKDMNQAAIKLGQKLVDQERRLDSRFKNETPTAQELKSLLGDIAKTRSELRFVHLSAHLKTPEILSTAQIEQYNDLRGYGSDDPCNSVPEGHDATMWKKHNNCD